MIVRYVSVLLFYYKFKNLNIFKVLILNHFTMSLFSTPVTRCETTIILLRLLMDWLHYFILQPVS